MHKNLILVVSLLTACAHTAPTNYAAAVLRVADKDAQCLAIHHAVGPDLADSALCGTHGALVYVSVSAKDLNMKTLAAAPAPAPTAPTAPTRPATPAPTPDPPKDPAP